MGTAPGVVTALTAEGIDFIYQASFIGAGAIAAGRLAPQRAASPQLAMIAAAIVRRFQPGERCARLDRAG